MFCKNCGSQLPDGTAFCGNCGAAQNAPAPAPVAEQPTPVAASVDVPAPAASPAPAPAAPYVDPTVMVEQPVSIPTTFPVAAPVPMASQECSPNPIPQPQPAKKKGHKGLIITLIIVIIVAGLGVTGWFLYDNGTFDDWFGGSTSSSQEEKEEESKDGSSSDNSSASSDPNSTASEEGVNSESNQGTPVTPPTTSIVYTFEQGLTVNNVYVNNWANLKFDVAKFPTPATIVAESEMLDDSAFEVYNDNQDWVYVSFYNEPGVGAEECLTSVCNEQIQSNDAEWTTTASAHSDIVIAGETYRTAILTHTSTDGYSYVSQVCYRKLDNYIIEIWITADDSAHASSFLSIFEKAR